MYPLNVGRWIPEIIRTVQALQIADCSNASTPANWRPGEPVIMKVPQTFKQLQERITGNERENTFSWYLAYEDVSKKCLSEKI